MLAVDQIIPTKIIPSPKDIEVLFIHLLSQCSVKPCLIYNSPNSGIDYQEMIISI